MKISHRFNTNSALRGGSYFVLASLLVPLAGCGGKSAEAPAPSGGAMAPPSNAMRPPVSAPNPNRPSLGLSGKQKVVLLAGAAALYYYYQKSKKATAAKYPNQQIQYYRSRTGAIYYRDPQTHQAITVQAPPSNYQPSISETEAQSYSGIQQAQGYNGAPAGNGLDYYFKPAPGATQ